MARLLQFGFGKIRRWLPRSKPQYAGCDFYKTTFSNTIRRIGWNHEAAIMCKILHISVILLSGIFLAGCVKEEKCPENETELQEIHIMPQWRQGDQKPEGIRVYYYSLETGKYVQNNLSADGGEERLRRGEYSMLMHNNDSEKIFFNNKDDYDRHEAYTRKVSRPSYISPAPEEETYDQPDMLWLASFDYYNVLKDACNEIRFCPRKMVHTYYGSIEAEGLENVQSIRGALTGMVSSIVLKSGNPGSIPGTVFFDAGQSDGKIRFTVTCFGVFKGNGCAVQKHYLVLEFLMRKGIATKTLDVTSLMNAIDDEDTICIDKPIVIPSDGSGGDDDGGFNANVGDWVQIIYPIPI